MIQRTKIEMIYGLNQRIFRINRYFNKAEIFTSLLNIKTIREQNGTQTFLRSINKLNFVDQFSCANLQSTLVVVYYRRTTDFTGAL